jgi:glutamate--cysteine ligase
MEYNEKLEKIVSYIKKGETKREDFRLGLEMEHFTIDKDSLESVNYYGDFGVCDTLERLTKKGFEVTARKNNWILGLEKDEYEITIEPAGQLEISIDGKNSLWDIKDSYDRIMKDLVEIYDEKNHYLVTLGYHPKSKIDDLDLIPKDRYKYMQEYFQEFGGKTALNMMKGTASLQTAVDFEDEEDFKTKFFVANALSVFLYSLFDNSYIFEGEPYPNRNLRQYIRENCDPKRTGVYDFAFDKDLSYEKYAKRILSTDIIFVNEDGQDIYKKDIKFEDIIDEDYSDEMIFHALSIVFPDVRLKRYIEIRMPDEVPAPYNFAFLALIKGLFYNKENLAELKEIFSDMTYENYEELRDASYKDGIFAKYKGKTINERLLDFIKMAEKGLEGEEEFLQPIYELMMAKTTLRDKFEILYKEDPKRAVERFSVAYYLDRKNNGQA